MFLAVRRPRSAIFFYRCYQSYDALRWMQYTIVLFRGNSQGPHHSPSNLSTGGTDYRSTETETAGTSSSPILALGNTTLAQELAQDGSASQAANN